MALTANTACSLSKAKFKNHSLIPEDLLILPICAQTDFRLIFCHMQMTVILYAKNKQAAEKLSSVMVPL